MLVRRPSSRRRIRIRGCPLHPEGRPAAERPGNVGSDARLRWVLRWQLSGRGRTRESFRSVSEFSRLSGEKSRRPHGIRKIPRRPQPGERLRFCANGQDATLQHRDRKKPRAVEVHRSRSLPCKLALAALDFWCTVDARSHGRILGFFLVNS